MENQDLVKVNVIVQYSYVGITSEEKIDSLGISLAKSAAALARATGRLREFTKGKTNGEQDEKKASTTKAYHFKMSLDDAISWLNDFDGDPGAIDTPDFSKKLGRYNAELEKIDHFDDLHGTARIAALKRLRPYSFKSWSVQAGVVLPPGADTDGYTVIQSKKHHRLQEMTASEVTKLFKGYKALEVPSDEGAGRKAKENSTSPIQEEQGFKDKVLNPDQDLSDLIFKSEESRPE